MNTRCLYCNLIQNYIELFELTRKLKKEAIEAKL